jgi:hypothetical protein
MTGAGWRANRTNMEDSIPLLYWHLNDPGTIPNVLQTGAGCPTGMIVYEGSLLPAQFHYQSPVAQKILMQTLQSIRGTEEYIELVTRYEVKSEAGIISSKTETDIDLKLPGGQAKK